MIQNLAGRPKENDIEDWTSGYVADIGYTYGYYPELNPVNIPLAFIYAGVVPPKVATGCELGFGQGVSVNVHAAASPVEWWGTDFNPSQAAFAQELAQASGAKAHLTDEAFAEFCARDDLPPLDYIGLHGIWSWINDENRKTIADFARRKLKVGGVLYVSYNTQPGWAAMVPMRDLFVEHSAVMGAPGQGLVSRIDASLGFAEKLLATNPQFARANPMIPERLKKIRAHNRNYVAHEYFNRDWQPMSFSSMSQWLAPAKLSFAVSANGLEAVDAVNLSAEQQALLAEIPDPGFRQTVRDFCMNQGFRKDYWVKGARRMTTSEQLEAVRRQSVVLVAGKDDVSFKATGAQGEVVLTEGIYRPVVDMLADNKPRTLGELEKELAAHKISIAQLVQAAMVLTGKGALQGAQDEAGIEQSKTRSDRFNRHVIKAAVGGTEIAHLASPVTGGAIAVPRIHQLYLSSISDGKKTPEAWARDTLPVISAQGHQVMKDGKPLTTPEESLAELTKQAKEFAEKRLPVIRALRAI